MRCQKCGDEINAGASYCDACGISLAEYPPVDSLEEGAEGRDPAAARRVARNKLIAVFVAIDVLVAGIILYVLVRAR